MASTRIGAERYFPTFPASHAKEVPKISSLHDTKEVSAMLHFVEEKKASRVPVNRSKGDGLDAAKKYSTS